MTPRPPRSTRTVTLFPYTTPFRSHESLLLQRLERPDPVLRQAHRRPLELPAVRRHARPARAAGRAFRGAALGARATGRRQRRGRGPGDRPALRLARQGAAHVAGSERPALHGLATAGAAGAAGGKTGRAAGRERV